MKILFCFLIVLVFGGFTVYAGESDSVTVMLGTDAKFSFSPNVTGYWTFYAAVPGASTDLENTIQRPFLQLKNEFGYLLAEGDLFKVQLVEDAKYIVQTSFWGTANTEGSIMLTIFWSDTFTPFTFTADPPVTAHTMPKEGGRIDAYGEVEISFTPDISGLWRFYVNEEGTPFPMWIEDPFRNILAFDNFLHNTENPSSFTVQLTAGAEYTIRTIMPMWIPVNYSIFAGFTETFEPWLDFDQLVYEGLYIDLSAGRTVIPTTDSKINEIPIENETLFSFTPVVTGPWVFYASKPEGNPLLVLTDTYKSFFLVDDNAEISVYLTAGVEYIIWARFKEENETGSYILNIRPFENIPPDKPILVPGQGGHFPIEADLQYFLFTPDFTGTWIIKLDCGFSNLAIADASVSFIVESQPWSWNLLPVIIMDLDAKSQYWIEVSANQGADNPTMSIAPANELRALNRRITPEGAKPQLMPPELR